MKSPYPVLKPKQLTTAAGCGLLAAVSVVAVGSHVQTTKGVPATVRLPYEPVAKITVHDGVREVVSNGIPDHLVGPFPNRGNPSAVSPQSYDFRVPLHPRPGTDVPLRPNQEFGVAVNGVVFDPWTAETWNGDRRWLYEALSGAMGARGGLGVDENYAHVQPNGAYHYHGLPTGLLKKLDSAHKMSLVGWAADGYPIYGLYAYAKADDAAGGMRAMRSSYRLKEGERPGGPGGAYDGSFASDYAYVKGSGDLDEHNGRFGTTPEFPKGTFYYVLTAEWPFVPRIFKGTPDGSFGKGPPGGGPGQGGPCQGPQGPGDRRQGPPRGMVPGDAMANYLGLTPAQKTKYGEFRRTVEALEEARFALGEFTSLRLTPDQIHRIGSGERLRDVLSREQNDVLRATRRPPGGGPDGDGPPPRR